MFQEPIRRFGEAFARSSEKPLKKFYPEHWMIAAILAGSVASAIYALL